MSGNPLMSCPVQLRAVQHYLKLAVDYEARQPVITYWARLYSLQTALKIDKKSPEARTLLANLMDWLEKFKTNNTDNESISSDMVGQAQLENEATKLFEFADSNDRASIFNKNVVKSFYTCGVLLDVCEVFGELSEEVVAQRKYAKWKATYIHNCLKQGDTPIPGPIGGGDDDEVAAAGGDGDDGEPVVSMPVPSLPPAPSDHPALAPVDASSPAHTSSTAASGVSAASLKQARKYCKWADSALDFQDVTTAVDNLTKALAILQPHN